ncbi:urea ABC transporter substrate-binding protein [Actinomadura barringtoniae]|uniref:Urea ABC transporter substrate-binding protein n=1 Tax=Actinomadura barringtoniae TaxID=1427535 RepID=A0A939P6B6_9ACTN|nr:urea ABC transporter substrate-binding protein [Actinomadura barringtoniae]MBO2446128.1 urea ABC transporter substrate-binding protein [Actinomadura barringtoniae]
MIRHLIRAAVAAAVVVSCCAADDSPETSGEIRVGILHSLTGTMALSEKSAVDAELMAIEEINAKGGLLGKRLRPVIADGRSDWPTFAGQAERLITREKVSVIFGCWTSASRKSVVPVVERHDHLLFYPLQYEGLERSPNVVYTGATPNQQIIPAVRWFLENRGKRVFLVGSDYVFPRAANAIIKDQVRLLGGKVVGEGYIPLGSKNVKGVVRRIIKAKPKVILNTINGDSNIPFFVALQKAHVDPRKTPTVSFSIAEEELRSLDVSAMAGNYAVWNYFQSIGTSQNRDFVARFKRRFGAQRVTDDPIEAAYTAVNLWARAVKSAGSADVRKVRAAVRRQEFDAPEGRVWVDQLNQHLWKLSRIGKIQPDGQFRIEWVSDTLIHPVPYPPTRRIEDWQDLLTGLHTGWHGNWARPAATPAR